MRIHRSLCVMTFAAAFAFAAAPAFAGGGHHVWHTSGAERHNHHQEQGGNGPPCQWRQPSRPPCQQRWRTSWWHPCQERQRASSQSPWREWRRASCLGRARPGRSRLGRSRLFRRARQASRQPRLICAKEAGPLLACLAKKQEGAPVWQAGPVWSTLNNSVSPSQSSQASTTRCMWPDVSPCATVRRASATSQVMSPDASVRVSASRFIQASISTAPLA